MRHLFIVNPSAGKKDSSQKLLTQIERSFPDGSARVELTQKQGDAKEIAARAIAEGGPIRIYACGGDGTLNEVVNAAAGCPDAAITNVPIGSGNDFLRMFGEKARERFLDLDALRNGPQHETDLLDCNGLVGLSVACAGVDARVAADVHKYKSLPLVGGSAAYVLALLVNVFFKGIARPMKIEMGPIQYDGDVSVLCVCNGRYYGGGFMPVGEAQPDDGVLDMLLVPKVSLLRFIRLVGGYAKGQYKKYPKIIRDYHGQKVTFSSQEEMVAVVDGEVQRGTAFTIRLSEKKVNFFHPADVFWRPLT